MTDAYRHAAVGAVAATCTIGLLILHAIGTGINRALNTDDD